MNVKLFLLPQAVWLVLLGLAATGAADDYKDTVLRDKPFAYYHLSESEASQPVADETGSNPGTFQNSPATGITGAIANDADNTAVTFDRSKGQYIQFTNFGKFGSSMTNGFSVEYWLKTSNFTDHQTIFGTANGPGFFTDFLADIAYGGNKKRFRMYIRDNRMNRYEANWYPVGKNINIFNDAWHHIVQIYAPKAEGIHKLQFYVDGQRQILAMMHKGGIPTFTDFNHPLTLGAMDLRGTEPDHLDGSLDEVAFYTTVLTPEQIVSHYRASGAGDHLRKP